MYRDSDEVRNGINAAAGDGLGFILGLLGLGFLAFLAFAGVVALQESVGGLGLLVIFALVAACGGYARHLLREGRALQRAQALAHEQAVHRVYRTVFTRKIEEVATPEELHRLESLWEPGEWSYDDRELHAELIQRWCVAHPACYPSQDQLRHQGFLCDCEPTGEHSCRPVDAARQLPNQAPPPELALMTSAKWVLHRRWPAVANSRGWSKADPAG